MRSTDKDMIQLEPFDEALLEYCSSSPDYRRYKECILRGCRAGDVLAKYARATWYIYGDADLGVVADSGMAFKLLAKISGFPRAQLDMAILCESGTGTKKDVRKAFRLYEASAKSGVVAAMGELARCLFWGIGAARDPSRALALRRRVYRLRKTHQPVRQGKPVSQKGRQQ